MKFLELMAGFAISEITPRVGVAMEGLGQRKPASSIHDSLFVRALSLVQGKAEILILSFDLLFFERGQVDRIKGAVGNRTGLSAAQILVNFTHTHCSPRVTRWAYGGQVEDAWMDWVVEQAANVAVAAVAERVPVRIEAGTTTTDLPVNRRLVDSDGVAQWKVALEGPVVRDVPCCLLRAVEDGRVVSVLFSVACHPSMIYEFAISAEFPGAAVRHLNSRLDTNGAIFLQGAAGDAKPRPAAGADGVWKPCTWEEMEAVGEVLAASVADCLHHPAVVEGELRARLEEVPWRLLPAPGAEVLQAWSRNEAVSPGRRAWAADQLQILECRGRLPKAAGILVHFVDLGPGLHIVAVEGEVLARLGTRLLAEMPPGVNFVLGYSNGTAIYLPDREDVPFGGYEVDSFWEYHWPSGPAADCDIPLVESVHRHFKDSPLA